MLPLAPEENFLDIFYLRVRLNAKLEMWDGPAVTKLLGYTNWKDITPEHIRVLRMLDGPNGYSVYKAMLARREHE